MARPGRPPLPSATYRRVANALRSYIRDGRWQPGIVVPPYRTLAKKFKVSAQTARLAVVSLTSEGLLCPNGLRRLVVAGRGSGHNIAAGSILEIVGRNLAMPFKRFEDDIQKGMLRGAGDLSRPLIIVHSRELLDVPPKELFSMPLAGIVLVLNIKREALQFYERTGIPTVLVDRPGENWKLHSASVDNETAARDATYRLFSMGHRRLAYVRYASPSLRNIDPNSLERQAGFLGAARDAGLPKRNISLFAVTPWSTATSPSITAIFRHRPRPTAILCSSWVSAEMIARAAAEVGLKVPRDFSLICFQSNVPELPSVAGPRIDFEDLGRKAVGLLSQGSSSFHRTRIPAPWADAPSVASIK